MYLRLVTRETDLSMQIKLGPIFYIAHYAKAELYEPWHVIYNNVAFWQV